MPNVQTSAFPASLQLPEPDMFPETCKPVALQFTGTLTDDAQLRTKPVGSLHIMHPVLCFELKDVGPAKMNLHAEQIYTEATRKHAEQQLIKYKRGAQITLTSDMADMRLVLPHIQSVELV